MKFITRYVRTVIDDRVHAGEDLHISSHTLHRKRKNQDPNSFQRCAYCLKRIDQDGETFVQVLEAKELHYLFHEDCWQEAQYSQPKNSIL